MKTNDKTLADVQPGGRVRLGDRLPEAVAQALATVNEAANDARHAGNYKVANALVNARVTLSKQLLALSAQPSPGGQDALAEAARRVLSDVDSGDYHGEISEATYAALEAALAARQPVGEVSVKKEDANNYCLILRALGMEEEGDPVAEVKALIEARDRQRVGEISDAQIDARLNALYREMVDSGQHNGGMSGVAWDRAVYRMASSQPAQAVDLGQFREAIESLKDAALHDRDPGPAVNAYNRVLALIDSQAVGK